MGFSCAVGAFVALVCLPLYPHISRTVKAQFAAKEAEASAALEKASSDKKIEVSMVRSCRADRASVSLCSVYMCVLILRCV